MTADSFAFAAARITGHDATGNPVPAPGLDLPVHGIVVAEPDPESRGSERFTLVLALTEHPALPPTAAEWGHDVLLWNPAPAMPFTAYRELWLHRATLTRQDTGPHWVSLSGPAWGRSLHLERQPPVPFDTRPCPNWEDLPALTNSTTGN
ncbi:hypothetical protein ACIP93_33790 [Streptomyces sp. NPDC088745]|uniref:hypothetical protein n=1 Tax=Streptomyces sp. NPDC088745 TaxID=3365884 RepID=UPI00382D5F3E